ncbi:hypothetical protein BDN72DRAFT_964271 [Pluteus cervinus]|uniref:Uncharacterized protein n=1 Tax=Pluteus cervinus TaxID=181527 RepID=A0ACD3ABD0_9AGAR|nr:hypothetical protein BDN72DRAFT_964271 [Pluteus cervinus]
MSELEEAQPIFPPEIEEIIFSLCAQSDLENSRNLILVAKRVHQWLIPQLYEVAIFHSVKVHGQPRYSSDLLKSHGRHVRHIMIWVVDVEEICFQDPATCLSWCPNLVNVALWSSATLYHDIMVDQLLGLHLTHLSFDVTLLHSAIRVRNSATLAQVSFPSVTHLELIGLDITFEAKQIREYFPSLTHISMRGDRRLSAQDMLNCWGSRLKLLIWHTDRPTFIVDSGMDPTTSTSVPDDPRVVVLPRTRNCADDWNESARGGPRGYWRMAGGQTSSSRC